MSGLREFGQDAVNAVLNRAGRGMSKVQERKPLSHDLLESDDAYLVVFDAPGASQSDIQVRFVDSEVQIRIDRFRDFYEEFEMRFPGRGLSLDGSAKLPDAAAVEPGSSSATLTKNGTLQVRIPKREDAREFPVTEESDNSGNISVNDGDENGEVVSSDDGHDAALEQDDSEAEFRSESDSGFGSDPDSQFETGGINESDETGHTDDTREMGEGDDTKNEGE